MAGGVEEAVGEGRGCRVTEGVTVGVAVPVPLADVEPVLEAVAPAESEEVADALWVAVGVPIPLAVGVGLRDGAEEGEEEGDGVTTEINFT